MEKYVSICPSCGRVYRHVVDKTQICFERSCSNVQTVYSGYTEPDWEALSDSDQDEEIKAIREGNVPSEQLSSTSGHSTVATARSPADVSESSFWISLMDTVANIFIFIGILGAIIGGVALFDIDALVGIAVMLLGTLFSLITAGTVKIFLGVAKDIHYLRKSAEANNNSKF